jgi:hypothetical protein
MNEFDDKKNYCRMLGHPINFSYCRIMNDSLPCGKVLDCWYELFPVEKYIETNYTPQEREKIFKPAKSRVDTIIDVIEKTKKSQ